MCGWSEEKIEVYLMDRLSAEENESFERHILKCADCQTVIAAHAQELIELEKAAGPRWAGLAWAV
jgi:Putative zinc-finger